MELLTSVKGNSRGAFLGKIGGEVAVLALVAVKHFTHCSKVD